MKIKKTKGAKSVTKRKLKFEDYKSSLEATQFENKVSKLEKKINIGSLREKHNKFIKNNK